jgi:hypothetical protein
MVTPVWLQLIIYTLAVMRITGLTVTDTITEPVRDALLVWLDDRPKTLGAFIAGLIKCPWCVSIWVGGITAPLVWVAGNNPIMLIPALMLAFSQVTGMTHTLGR